ncbi:MAG TPA: ABC transporter permease subunit, partial [Bacteroidales bacterium]|nr:ABC transporter permease subunit [Bacteroidales bacterium]
QPIIPPSDFHPIIQNKENDKADTMFEDNGISNLISPFDLITITGILLSLLAILFSYDSISGEREDGTLKLLLSNHLPRPLLLTG